MSKESCRDARPQGMAAEVDDAYYIEGVLDVMGHLAACHKCGRKILVEMTLIGVQHHLGVSVTCGDCLVLPEQFRKEQPEIASKIEGWLHGRQENTPDQS